MLGTPRKVRFWALLLGIIFLAAQFHFCSDLNSSGSHFCQLCSAAGSAVTTPAAALSVVPLTHHLEVAPAQLFPSSEPARATTSRAPPSQSAL